MIFLPFILGLLFLIILVICIVGNMIYVVRQAEVIIIERLGKFDRILGPGLHILIPLFDSARSVVWTFVQQNERRQYMRYIRTFTRIDLREAVYDFPKQNVITRDNVTMEINALLYYQITDPRAAVYEVANLPEAIEKLTQTTLRNVIGSMDLDESLISRDNINTRLRIILDDATDKWGVKVNRVELQEVNPPEDIKQAMEKQMRAEREKRETILRSEGSKRAAILEAEGQQQAQVLCAQGDADARIIRSQSEAQARLNMAQAEAKSIDIIRQVVPNGDTLSYLIAQQYIKTLPSLTEGKDTKLVVVPYEATAVMGSLSSMKELFNTANK